MIIFPDIEALLISWLTPREPVLIATRVPAARPTQMVQLNRTGGPQATRVSDKPVVTFFCCAETSPEASELGSRVRALVGALVGQHGVYRVTEVSGLANYPDPDADWERYTFSVQIHIRGSATIAP